MFCATFYSYKGGVGRTLALANVAVNLALRGKRVLVVDFDLEAPGLTTLSAFRDASQSKGVVEFLGSYLDTGVVPDVGDYISSCQLVAEDGDDWTGNTSMDVMPAGQAGDDYAQRFRAIDWADLYVRKNGFLLMEDLRSQWAERGYDYVLIDSRTGLTDSGGICTRQLPDAVVCVFFPNEQNLIGLKKVVPEIRQSQSRERPISTLFAASRVPKLDDEYRVLEHWLDRFHSELDYKPGELVTIEQYDSLALLDQALFTLNRPSSGLAAQYRVLTSALSEQNSEDADGSLAYLRRLARSPLAAPAIRTSAARDLDNDVSVRLNEIATRHQDDAIVQRALAVVYRKRRQLVDAAIATDRALSADGRTATQDSPATFSNASVHQVRLQIFTDMDATEEVVESARAILGEQGISDALLIAALLALANSDQADLAAYQDPPALQGASVQRLLTVAKRLSGAPAAAQIAAAIAEKALTQLSDLRDPQIGDPGELQVLLIAGRKFDLAAALGETALESSMIVADDDEHANLAFSFNTAMARWGRDGEPDVAEFKRVETLFGEDPANMAYDHQEANYAQCRAFTAAVLGQLEDADAYVRIAKQKMTKSAARELSAWSFLISSPFDFVNDCEEIRLFARRSGPTPKFLRHDP